MTPPYLRGAGLPVRHGFFTRVGGVSRGGYASLNCSLSGQDDPACVAENRSRVAAAIGAPLLGLHQVHGAAVAEVIAPWLPGAGPRADAMVTRRRDVALAIVTADCAPVLLADAEAGVIGAAHAGWRGAVAGVLEATVAAMLRLGADAARIVAAIGPCIGQPSYEVGEDVRVAAADEPGCLAPGRMGHWQFDLPGYCAARLRRAGVGAIEALAADTLAEPDRFFSHRRRTLAGEGPIGHQVSVVLLDTAT